MDEPMLLAPHLDAMMEEERAYRNAVRKTVESGLYLLAVLLVGSLLLTFVSWQAGSVTMLRYFDDGSWAESRWNHFGPTIVALMRCDSTFRWDSPSCRSSCC